MNRSFTQRRAAGRLQPVTGQGDGSVQGLFTGYYEPLVRGSRKRHGAYQIPLYRQPPDLVQVDLGEFRDSLKGQRIAGRVRDGRLKPYDDRSGIEAGSLEGRNLELVWLDEAADDRQSVGPGKSGAVLSGLG